MSFRSAFNHAKRVVKKFSLPSMTKQSFTDECNIHNILRKYQATGLIEHQNRFAGDYGDYINVQDYQASLNAVNEARATFEALPANVRARCNNDPAVFLSFVADPSNRQEMFKLGLLSKDPSIVDAPLAAAPTGE